MTTPLAEVPALEARLGRTLDPDEVDMATAALATASAKVRHYGLPWPDPATAPDVAVEVTLDAAERKMRNPEGLRSEMDGSYQLTRPASTPTGVTLTTAEVRMIRAAAGVRGIFSVPVKSLGGEL